MKVNVPGSDLRLLILHDSDSAEADWAVELHQRLEDAFQANAELSSDTRPIVERLEAYENLPDPVELSAVAPVLIVLPDPSRGFTPGERERIQRFRDRAGGDDYRIIPIARDSRRNVPPAPLADLMSQLIHDLTDSKVIDQLSTYLLNVM